MEAQGRYTDLPPVDSTVASQSHFSDVFHRATGLTPNAYRQARR